MEVKATRVAGYNEAKNPGEFFFTRRVGVDGHSRLMFRCPCGCGDLGGISINASEHPSWDWDGNEEKPTVTPSILKTGPGCTYHGFLTDGVFRSC